VKKVYNISRNLIAKVQWENVVGVEEEND